MQALGIILDIIILLLALGIIITIHEFGHFFVARIFDVQCHEFSIGMGPLLYQKKKYKGKRMKTFFSIRAIPLGGFAAMAGEDEESSYLKKGDIVSLKLNENKYVEKIIFNGAEKGDINGKVVAFNVYDDSRKLYITIEKDGELLKYYFTDPFDYVFKKNKIEQNASKKNSFEAKSKFKRFLILFAGPMMNFILAFFLFIFIGMISGKQIKDTNIIGKISNQEIKKVLDENSIKKGFKLIKVKTNDKEENVKSIKSFYQFTYQNISNKYTLTFKNKDDQKDVIIYPTIIVARLGINNKGFEKEEIPTIGESLKTKKIDKGSKIIKIKAVFNETSSESEYDISSYKDLSNYLEKVNSGSVFLTLEMEKDGVKKQEVKEFEILSKETIKLQGINNFIIDFGINPKTKFSFYYALKLGFSGIYDTTVKTINTLKSLFDSTSGVGIKDLTGPVGLFQVVKKTRQRSFSDLLYLVAFISVNIGFINLLPIPALDGGRIMFVTIEALIGRKLSKKIEGRINLIAFILLMGLMVFVFGNDILKLFIK